MADDTRPVVLAREGATATVTLNRPHVRNAVDLATLEALDAIVARLEAERPRVVILRAAAPGFSAGIDLKESRDASPAFARHRVAVMHRVLRRLRSLPLPVVAAIDGVCVGLGVELAISADIRLATPASRFSYREVAVAVPSPAHHLVRLIGLARAQDMLLTARWVEADAAERWGLITRVVADAEAAARSVADEIAVLSPGAVALTKENLWLSVEAGVEAGALHHIEGITAMASTEDRLEALAAFAEKRPPRFTGR